MFPLNVRSTVAAVGSFRALHPKEVAEAPRSASLSSKWPSAAMPACRASQPALCIHTTASAACWLNQAMVFLLLKPLVKKLKAGGKTLAWFSWIASFSSPKVFIPLFFNLFKAPENGNSQDKTFPKENPSLSFKNMKIKHFEASFVFLSYEAIHWLWPKSSLTHIPPKLPFCKQAIKEKSLAQSQSSPLYLEMQNDLRCPILKLVIEIRDLIQPVIFVRSQPIGTQTKGSRDSCAGGTQREVSELCCDEGSDIHMSQHTANVWH